MRGPKSLGQVSTAWGGSPITRCLRRCCRHQHTDIENLRPENVPGAKKIKPAGNPNPIRVAGGKKSKVLLRDNMPCKVTNIVGGFAQSIDSRK
jgi:hypothetical protein